MHDLWPAMDHEGEVLESFVSKARDKPTALNFIMKLTKRHGRARAITTNGMRSCNVAMNDLGNADRLEVGKLADNRAENSHNHHSDDEGAAVLIPNDPSPALRRPLDNDL